MTDTDTEFRDEIRAVVRRHDPDPAQLRGLASDLERLADKWEDAGDIL